MDEITLRNFRCFRDEQTVRLAPLTLLVGENSTGKTSFMAMVRALWELAFHDQIPDFKDPPYDLGSFDEIAHHRGARGSRAEEIFAAFKIRRRISSRKGTEPRPSRTVEYRATFRKRGTAPFPVDLCLSGGQAWVQYQFRDRRLWIRFGTKRGSWKAPGNDYPRGQHVERTRELVPFRSTLRMLQAIESDEDNEMETIEGEGGPGRDDYLEVLQLSRRMRLPDPNQPWPYASAPVRSVPRRTYDPRPFEDDPEGEYVPMYLASIFFHESDEWNVLKARLEAFGRESGLFDEIAIRSFGKKDSEPFQVQVRKYARTLKGPMRNLIDVGYGVSQAIPVLTELLREDCSPILLLQQPEVHLHPSAQAALGSLFCNLAGPKRQLVVETHSDHLLDRVRMEIRDGAGTLGPDDVSVLFFERGELDVQIHSLRIDKDGNVLGAPDTYRSFFLEETTRSLGL